MRKELYQHFRLQILLKVVTREMIKSYGYDEMQIIYGLGCDPTLHVKKIDKYRINEWSVNSEDLFIHGEDNIVTFINKLKLPEERNEKLNRLGINEVD
jgi:hypothetical protein